VELYVETISLRKFKALQFELHRQPTRGVKRAKK